MQVYEEVGIYEEFPDYDEPPAKRDEDEDDDDDDDDPNWCRGMTGESDDEDPEAKAARKKARHEKAIQESCIAAALEEKRKRKLAKDARKKEKKEAKKKKKKKKSRHNPPPDRATGEAQAVVVVLPNGKRLEPVDSTKVKGAYIGEYGDYVRDNALKLRTTAKDGKDVLHETASKTEENDMACIRRAALSESSIPLGELSVRIGLARMLGSRERAEHITKNDPRHHSVTALPPFAAFQPECTDPAITRPSGDKTRPFPVSLLNVGVTDRTSAFNQAALSCPSLGGFETVSGAQRYKEGLGSEAVYRRVRPEDAQDSTKRQLFTVRSSYSDITSLYWIQLSARDVSLMHLLLTELVALSGVDAASCVRVLPPVTDHFSTATLNPPDGRMPWNFGEACSSGHYDKPLKSMRDQEFGSRGGDHTDRVLLTARRAIDEILATSLPEKTKIFVEDREPRRPVRRSQFSDANLKRFLELRPQLRQAVRVDPQWGQMDARDLAMIEAYVTDYLKGYLDWRYFVLPDMVIGALAIAYETIHPAMNDGFVIRTTDDEHTCIRRSIKRMCVDTFTSCPATHMLFRHYYSTGYEKYAAALLLWNFIGRKKVLVLNTMKKHDAKKKRLVDSGKAPPKRLPPLKYRPDIVPFDAVFDMYGRNEAGSADMSSVCPVEFIEHVKSRINDVYKWNLFPQLFHDTVREVSTVVVGTQERVSSKGHGKAAGAPKVDYVAFDKDMAREHRVRLKAAKRKRGEEVRVLSEDDTDAVETYVKAMYKGKVRVSYDQVPKECQKDLDAAVKIFDESFTHMGQREYARIGTGAFRAYWNARKAVKLVRAYMNVHKLLSEGKQTSFEMMLLHTRDHRKEVPGIEKYASVNGANIVFKLDLSSALGRWYKENLEQDSAKLAKLAK